MKITKFITASAATLMLVSAGMVMHSRYAHASQPVRAFRQINGRNNYGYLGYYRGIDGTTIHYQWSILPKYLRKRGRYVPIYDPAIKAEDPIVRRHHNNYYIDDTDGQHQSHGRYYDEILINSKDVNGISNYQDYKLQRSFKAEMKRNSGIIRKHHHNHKLVDNLEDRNMQLQILLNTDNTNNRQNMAPKHKKSNHRTVKRNGYWKKIRRHGRTRKMWIKAKSINKRRRATPKRRNKRIKRVARFTKRRHRRTVRRIRKYNDGFTKKQNLELFGTVNPDKEFIQDMFNGSAHPSRATRQRYLSRVLPPKSDNSKSKNSINSSDNNSSSNSNSENSVKPSDNNSDSNSNNQEVNLANYPEEEIQLINQDRAAHGKAPLNESPILDKIANMRAQQMANGAPFSHKDPNNNYINYYVEDAKELGYNVPNKTMGENLAAGDSTPEDANNALYTKEEPYDGGHYQNIISEYPDEQYTDVGVGVAYNPNSEYGTYWAEDFYNRYEHNDFNNNSQSTTDDSNTTLNDNKSITTSSSSNDNDDGNQIVERYPGGGWTTKADMEKTDAYNNAVSENLDNRHHIYDEIVQAEGNSANNVPTTIMWQNKQTVYNQLKQANLPIPNDFWSSKWSNAGFEHEN